MSQSDGTDLVVPVLDEGLGNTAYLVDLGDDRALVVDASRDLRMVHASAERRGLRIAFAADTHLHADFLSGARQLAAGAGARVLASAAGGREFSHVGLGDEDEVDLGGLTLRAWATPGHTDEHLSFLLLDGARVLGVFTGGSLLVGSAARTDLVAPERAEELARAQYRSLQRLARLDDEVAVWPTHGAGSFCSAPTGRNRTSTIGAEKATNHLLAAPDEDTFVRRLLESLGTFPAYFHWLAEENRRGPAVLAGTPPLPALDVAAAQARQSEGAQIVDVRPARAFAAAHPLGALSIPLRAAFASWLGWLVPRDQPVVVLRAADQDIAEVVWQAAKIGYDSLVGEIAGGIEAWQAAGAPVGSVSMVRAAPADGVHLLDVRQTSEFVAGHVPGARLVQLGDLGRRLGEVPEGPTVVMCGHGERAMTAASLLERAGHSDLRVFEGGPREWAAANGQALVQGR